MPSENRGVLLVEDADGVRLLTFNRPEVRNAFNQELWLKICDALTEAADDPAIRCVVLTGTGSAFTAGMDLTEMLDTSVFEQGEEPGYRRLMPIVESFPKVLIAAVNGVGVGIGLTILPHCDLVFMAESARVKAPFVSLGVTTEASASVLLPATIGWQQSAHLLFTEPWLYGPDAERLGLAFRCCPDDELLEQAMAEARAIGAMPVTSLMATKRMLLAGRGDVVRLAREREEREFERLIGSEENRAALESFFGS